MGIVAMVVNQTKEDDQNSLVKEYHHGGYDVKCIRSIYHPGLPCQKAIILVD